MNDDFTYGECIEFIPGIEWCFELGKFMPVINGVCVPAATKVNFTTEDNSLYRVIFYGRDGGVVAYYNLKLSQKLVLSVSVYPRFFIYHLHINEKIKEEYATM